MIARPMTAGELSRRQVLGLMAAGAGVALLRFPLARAAAGAGGLVAPIPGFLSSDELAILDAATARIIPTDSQVGARECGVLNYIQSMLSYMPGSDANCDRRVDAADVTATVLHAHAPQASCPHGGDVNGDGVVDAADVAAAESAVFGARPILAGGPFSGRQAQAHFPTGNTPCHICHAPSPGGSAAGATVAAATVDNYPPNFFAQFLPLSRLHALSWKIRLQGAAAVPEVADNPLATESLEVDLRRKYRDGLASLATISQSDYQTSFVRLTPAQQSVVLGKADASFVTLLTYHTVEGILCVPEYGGNRDRLGWQLVGFDGDSQPRGYTIYDEATGQYHELDDKPNSRPNPNEDCHGFSTAVNGFLTVISSNDLTKPGRKFTSPFCLDVPS